MNSKPRILIVDDEPLNVKLFAAILSSDSYEIIRAFNGEQALEKVNEECPDLILLDIMMPGIDGFEVTRQLKGRIETRDIPIILITAFDVADYKVIGYEAGADEFLNKPVKAPELKSRVKSLLRTKEYQDKLKLQKLTESDKSCDNGDKTLHGEKVAFGVICQLVIENRPTEELHRVIDFCLSIGLPITLEELNVEATADNIRIIAEASMAFNWLSEPFCVTSDMVYDAIFATNRPVVLHYKKLKA